ncbi:MAG: AbrB/MazE/SpoVT family DNA-binding domain-containing protein [Candidatus Helarchaeota archaeon]
MVSLTKIDSQGRILIPAEFRRKLGLEADCEVGLTVIGNDLIIRKVNTNLKAQVEQWKHELLKMPIPIGIANANDIESDKWMDKDYAERKLGVY